eukprot:m.245436 g.245436  ORF g.245436 m.245436 type:complete len:329 (-) comp33837_c3_seq11:415-1401(-)
MIMEELQQLRETLKKERDANLLLEQELEQKRQSPPQKRIGTSRKINRLPRVFEAEKPGHGSSSNDDYEESSVNDVLTNLAALSSASGDIQGENSQTPQIVSSSIPEDSKVLSRTLGRSVRNGQLNKNRAMAAAKWVDKEIRKLIDLIKNNGSTADGKTTITFGKLFKLAEDVMEAVAGTLKTAKRKNVVAYDTELLMQGMSDHIVISLLKTDIEDSTIDTYTYRQIRQCSVRANPGGHEQKTPSKAKGKCFGQTTLQNTANKCFTCSKTVYAMEFVGAAGHAFHKSCFRCSVCKGLLRGDNFATMDDVFYCKTHFTELFNKKGGYNFE